MRRLVGALLLLVAAALPSSASYDYIVDGYRVYQGSSYYWYGNRAYTRYYVPGYYSYGYYYPGYYRYTYSHTYVAPAAAVSSSDWRGKLLDLAAARDRAESRMRYEALAQHNFMAAVQALGLQGNFRWEGYGAAPPYAPAAYSAGSSLQLSSAGAQGRTVYGYSYNTISSVYGDTNLALLYQQAARLTDNVQKIAGQATVDFASLVGKEGENRARVASILARGQAAAQALKAAQESGGTLKTEEFRFKVAPNGNGDKQPEAPPEMPPAEPPPQKESSLKIPANWQALLATSAQKCVQCHGPQTAEGKFDVRQYLTMTPEQQLKVIARLTTDDHAKVMPRRKDGSPGERLAASEVALWRIPILLAKDQPKP